MKTELIHPKDLDRAKELLLQKEVVAFPTETVYGLGACVFFEEAVQKIFLAKGRPSDNPLITHISDLAMVEEIATDIPPLFYKLAEEFFPGPLTLIIPKSTKVPLSVSAGLSTVAIRMPSHLIALDLIRLVGQPLVAPSANLSGKPSPTNYKDVLEDLDGKIAGVVLGEQAEIGIESTVLSLLGGQIELLRPGFISKEAIEEFLKETILFNPKDSCYAGASPGMKYRHYAPNAKVILFESLDQARAHVERNIGMKRCVLSNDPSLSQITCPLNMSSFYGCLRQADRNGCEEVVIFCDALTQKNMGLMNRIEKAAGII